MGDQANEVSIFTGMLPEEVQARLKRNQLSSSEEIETMELAPLDDTEWLKVKAQLEAQGWKE